jgi:hypothetical protein
MACGRSHKPIDDADDPGERDDPRDEDLYEEYDDDSETQPCPECGEEIYEDADRCPRCGANTCFEPGVWTGRPWWWVTLGLLGVVGLVLALAAGR